MQVWRLLSSYRGRIGRAAYWVGSIGIVVMLLLLNAVAQLISLQVQDLMAAPDTSAKLTWSIVWLVVALAVLVLDGFCLWASLAVSAKRWHDRNKSAVWILVGMIPIVGWIWTFVECGCLPGTPGPNRYGDGADPAAIASAFS